ncbi:MAG: isoleucine--tRNA ligase [Deltaproteobacteria bacterium]|nr:isoleucine--tRNA ligase [Deltaproteobacteria bacterium]
MTFKEAKQQINFPTAEEAILGFWQENHIFEKSVQQRSADKLYTFYDGPPFATGLPHYGHLLAGIIKDIVPRYWAMKGYHIERRFGWDCHGLPVEYEIDKKLGISGSQGVKKIGIKNYNAECRNIVLRYTREWEKTVNRMGRWVDFKNDYKTMDPSFMESVWYVFKKLWDKGLIYKGHRVMPYSTAVTTPLSNFEAGSNYKEVQDPAITVSFKIPDQENTSFLAWTTTPWTLPSNLALAVGLEIEYVKIFSKIHDQKFILGKNRLATFFKKDKDYVILETYKGKDLEGIAYTPLFDYFAHKKTEPFVFTVIVSEHVTDDDGTGIVHMAPAFGEDDYNICKKYNIQLVMPVDDDGLFTQEVSDFAGRYVKDADKDIIARLKEKGLLFRHDTVNHNYPYCWRSDTPLIYRAVSSWFVNVEKIKHDLIQNNKSTHWVPKTLRDGRFGNWLENARDWNISRSRYWGNPIPIWENKETGEYICVGSIGELESLTGQNITDLHRENIDHLEIPDPRGRGVFRRVPEVLDCWFESGSMPYAQSHYPFENKAKFEKGFPADFIAEGLDQTRGWFYTLGILGTALFNSFPFKNVIVNGMVLAEDGKKMSKRLQNYPDPGLIIDTHGADALRLYMIQSPAVRAEELRFSETGVRDIVRRILLKWWHSYSFLVSYAVIDHWQPEAATPPVSDNILDQWIVSKMQSLLFDTEKEMACYHLYNVVPALLDFIEDLTNVYIRFNRKRFWDDKNPADKEAAYQTLYYILYTMTTVMAPFTPFLAEQMYQNLKPAAAAKESVHLEDFPEAEKSLIKKDLEESIRLMNRVVLMVRNIREKNNIKIKIPLKNLAIIHREQVLLDNLKQIENYLKEELNLRHIDYLTNEDDFVALSAKANGAALGRKLGKMFAPVNTAIMALDNRSIVTLEQGEHIEVEGVSISREDVLIYRTIKQSRDNIVSDAFITVDLDISLERDQILEGLAREVVNRIQKLRKTADLKLSDRINVTYTADPEITEAVTANLDYIKEQTLSLDFSFNSNPEGQVKETCDIDDKKLLLALTVA